MRTLLLALTLLLGIAATSPTHAVSAPSHESASTLPSADNVASLDFR